MAKAKQTTRSTNASSNNGKAKNAIGGTIAAVAAIGALIAGTFLFAGDRGKKNRTMVRGWMVRAKGEVLEQLEKMKDVSAETYNTVVDDVLKRYKKVKDISAEELVEFGDELRAHWKTIAKEMKQGAKKAKRISR